MRDRKGIVNQLHRREVYGTVPQRDFKMMRKLVESPTTRYKVILEGLVLEGRPVSFIRHLYANNFKKCYNIRNCKQRPFVMYKRPSVHRSKRTSSAVLFECPIGQDDFHATMKDSSYKSCLIQVTADGWLYRTDMNTGAVIQKVFLCPQYKLKDIAWEKDLERVVIQSVQYHNNVISDADINSAPGIRYIPESVVVHLALFSVAPFEFLCLAPIDKRIFGNDVITATISTGLLVVMHKKKVLIFYNFEEIMQKYCVRYRLGQEYQDNGQVNEKGCIGHSPLGLVPNLIITEKPSELLKICSDHDTVYFGGFPWHFTTMPSHNKFLVHDLSSGQVVENGCFETDDLGINTVYFHGDNSGRILHAGAHTVRFLSLSRDERDSLSTLKEDFVIPSVKRNPVKLSRTTVTASGRQVKRRVNTSLVELQTETLHDVDYDDELGLLVVLSSTIHEGGEIRGHLGLYDNQTGFLVREIPLHAWEEECEHVVCMDRDTIVTMTASHERPVKCTVLQLET